MAGHIIAVGFVYDNSCSQLLRGLQYCFDFRQWNHLPCGVIGVIQINQLVLRPECGKHVFCRKFIIVFCFEGNAVKCTAMHFYVRFILRKLRYIAEYPVAWLQKQTVDKIKTADRAVTEYNLLVV